jgi:hypothetical protein
LFKSNDYDVLLLRKSWDTNIHGLKRDSTSESELLITAFKNSTVECRTEGIAQYFRHSEGLDDWGSVPVRANVFSSP